MTVRLASVPRVSSFFPFLALLALQPACGDDTTSGGGGAGGTGAGGTGGTGGETPAGPSLGLNDVSVLFPMPAGNNPPGYLEADAEGMRGELLPKDVYDAIPQFPVTPSQGLVFNRMHVLSVRFDGCGGGVDACEPEIRLVMQPLDSGDARDSALHLFYRLDHEEMAEVVSKLRAMRALAPEATVEGPLDVHPALVAQGVEGAYGTALRELILTHAGEENLVRMTFFLRAPPVNEVWFFGGFDRDGETLTSMNVVGVGTDPQRVILTKSNIAYTYDLLPIGATPEDGSVLYSSGAAEDATEDERSEAFASYLRVDDPTVYVPDHLPCAGCHISTYVTAEATRKYGLDATTFEDGYTSTRDLTMRGAAATTPSSLRAFGWFEGEAMISQRTINETAHVADDFDTRYPVLAAEE